MRLWLGLLVVLLLTGCFAKTDDIPKEDQELNNEEVSGLPVSLFERGLSESGVYYKILTTIVPKTGDLKEAYLYDQKDDYYPNFELLIFVDGSLELANIVETGKYVNPDTGEVLTAITNKNFVLVLYESVEEREAIIEAFNNIK